jgi:hypothetical protein
MIGMNALNLSGTAAIAASILVWILAMVSVGGRPRMIELVQFFRQYSEANLISWVLSKKQAGWCCCNHQ